MKICIPLISSNIDELCKKIKISSKKADIIEIWLGEFFSDQKLLKNSENFLKVAENILERIFSVKKASNNIPFLINVKPPSEKGNFSGNEKQKIFLLKECIKRGAEYIDIDYEFNSHLLYTLKQETQIYKSNLILSAHFFNGTPTFPSLKNRVERMKNSGADIMKIATMPKSPKDLITLLRFAENMGRNKIKFIAMAMGKIGKISRVLTPLLGGEMMFAPISKEESSAPGQICREDLLELEKTFNWN